VSFKFTNATVVKLDNSAGTPVDITSYCQDVNVDRPVAMLDTTVLGLPAPTFIPGLLDGDTVPLTLLWDPTIEAQIVSLIPLTVSTTLEVAPIGTTTGNRKITVETFVKKVGRPMKVGALIQCTVELQKTGAVTETVY
jgi:hypothetical protein